MKILILCTGNSCRSQMAEVFLQSFDKNLEVYSAGTNPADKIHPLTKKVMAELGFNLNGKKPVNVDNYLAEEFDYVITVCDDALASCPVFSGKVKRKLHMGFEDPAKASGSDIAVLNKFREIRDKIKREFYNFYKTEIASDS